MPPCTQLLNCFLFSFLVFYIIKYSQIVARHTDKIELEKKSSVIASIDGHQFEKNVFLFYFIVCSTSNQSEY